MTDPHHAHTLPGVHYPIIQAPMAGVSTPALAAAVSQAGGLGSIATGASDADQMRASIVAVRTLTDRPFNVNLFCHAPGRPDTVREAAWLAYLRPHFAAVGASPPDALRESFRSFIGDAAMLDMLLTERPAVVSFHFGLPPAATIAALKQAGITLLASATCLREAALVEQAGIDWIIAQGVEAGGHRGVFDPQRGDEGIGTLALVRLFARRTKLPVIAAGGIMDGRGIAAAMALGAAAVQLGTAFVLAPESAADAAYRAVLTAAAGNPDAPPETRLVTSISGRAARGLVGRWMTEIENAAAPPLPDYSIAYDAAKALHRAASAQGDHSYAVNWAGQGVALARAIPAADMVALLVEEWQHATGAPGVPGRGAQSAGH